MFGFKFLRISDQALVQILGQGPHLEGYEVVSDGLPADTKIVDVVHDPYTMEIKLKIVSSEFPALPSVAPETICPRLRMRETSCT